MGEITSGKRRYWKSKSSGFSALPIFPWRGGGEGVVQGVEVRGRSWIPSQYPSSKAYLGPLYPIRSTRYPVSRSAGLPFPASRLVARPDSQESCLRWDNNASHLHDRHHMIAVRMLSRPAFVGEGFTRTGKKGPVVIGGHVGENEICCHVWPSR